MFPVYLKRSTEVVVPAEPFAYILGRNGAFVSKRTNIFRAVVPASEVPSLAVVRAEGEYLLPPIPAALVASIVAFFRAVHRRFRSEAILVIAYHLEHRTFQCIAPPQIVSGDACDYTPPLASDLPDGYRCVGTVHSHGELPAFHSCTDEDDERVSDGIHITVGRLDQQVVEIVASLAVSGCRFPQAVERVLGGVRPVHRRVRVARRSVRRHELLRLVERFERTGHRADLAELLSHLPMGSADRCIGYEVERVHTTAGGAGAGTHPEWMRMVAQPPVRRRRASHTPSAKVLTAPARLGTPKGAAGAPRRVLRRWQ